jgi:site-specific DNA recombinase
VKTAVSYLRVSTPSQVHTDDRDPEGISIPAQRLACQRKAEQMGLTIVGEYVEPGRSATTIEKRPVFQEMLARIKNERDVDYLIIYNLSRLNRNRIDDVKVLMAMRSLKVTLVSAQENIDETPSGQLMHGILAAINEYRSNADGADIRYKMGQKAKNGGTVTRTKIGYLNVREMVDGHEIRTVALDPDRAPYVQLAFELAATGDYTMDRLARVLAERGLRMRPSAKRPAGPISANYLARMLRDRYYLGFITYDGEEYPGRHEPLVTAELFARVQAALDERLPRKGSRQRRHYHYLKGHLWCGRCHDKGVESRLLLTKAKGHGGEYWYFFLHRAPRS